MTNNIEEHDEVMVCAYLHTCIQIKVGVATGGGELKSPPPINTMSIGTLFNLATSAQLPRTQIKTSTFNKVKVKVLWLLVTGCKK